MSANSVSEAPKKLLIRVIIYLICTTLLVIYVKLCELGMGFPCLFNEIWGITCPSCGATRAVFSIISGNFNAAIAYNPVFTLALYPIIAILLLQDLYISVNRVLSHKDRQSIIEFAWIFPQKTKRGDPT